MTETATTRKFKGALRLRLKFVQAWVDDDGRAHHYFRRAGYPRVRLPGLPGSPEFNRAYEAALGSQPELLGSASIPIGAGRSKPGSVAAVIAGYFGSSAFCKELKPDTQAVRRFVLEAFKREHGDKLIRHMPRKFLAAMLDVMEPTAAKNWLAAIRALVRYAIKADLLDDDPTLGIRLRRMSGDGYHTWSEDEIAVFEAHHAIGSRERLAMALGLYTAQRRGDAIRMGRQHLSDCRDPRLLELTVKKMLFVRQRKTGMELRLPVHAELQVVLVSCPPRR
jgi:hypothetical protein